MDDPGALLARCAAASADPLMAKLREGLHGRVAAEVVSARRAETAAGIRALETELDRGPVVSRSRPAARPPRPVPPEALARVHPAVLALSRLPLGGRAMPEPALAAEDDDPPWWWCADPDCDCRGLSEPPPV
jgi:hypothetical protein